MKLNVEAGLFNSEKARKVEEGYCSHDSDKLQKWKLIMWNNITHKFAYIKYGEDHENLFSFGYSIVMRNVSYDFAKAFVMYVTDYKIQSNKNYTHNDICAWTDEFQFVHYIFSKYGFIKEDKMLLRKHTSTIYC